MAQDFDDENKPLPLTQHADNFANNGQVIGGTFEDPEQQQYLI